MKSDIYARRSARVVLVDARGYVLLLRSLLSEERPQLGWAWYTPGGGVEKGESLSLAAARELREETGIAVVPGALGRVIAYTTGTADFGWAAGWFRDDFFFYRTEHHEVDVAGMELLEQSHFLSHRWWSIEDLAETNETIYPLGLAALVADLLEGAHSLQPVQLPWHH